VPIADELTVTMDVTMDLLLSAAPKEGAERLIEPKIRQKSSFSSQVRSPSKIQAAVIHFSFRIDYVV
jgi:hypothetical protein